MFRPWQTLLPIFASKERAYPNRVENILFHSDRVNSTPTRKYWTKVVSAKLEHSSLLCIIVLKNGWLNFGKIPWYDQLLFGQCKQPNDIFFSYFLLHKLTSHPPEAVAPSLNFYLKLHFLLLDYPFHVTRIVEIKS